MRTPREGTFVRIPLADGTFAYGRVLAYGQVAFYQHRTQDPSSDLDEIEGKPILFIQAVRHLGLERWTAIGQRALQGEVAKPVVGFVQDVADYRECTIFDSVGMERKATPEECVGLERASSWDAHHIEQRLLDAFMGRPNDMELRSRVRFE
jgi:hypothetical protein